MPTRVTLTSRLPELQAEMRLRVSADCKETADNIAEDAANRVNLGPVAPHIADDIQVTGGAAQFTVGVGKDEYYAKWVEFGRKNAPPYPFLIPAAEAEREPFEQRVNATLSTL